MIYDILVSFSLSFKLIGAFAKLPVSGILEKKKSEGQCRAAPPAGAAASAASPSMTAEAIKAVRSIREGGRVTLGVLSSSREFSERSRIYVCARGSRSM